MKSIQKLILILILKLKLKLKLRYFESICFNMILLTEFHNFLIINSHFLIFIMIFLNFFMFINSNFFFQNFCLLNFLNIHNFKNLSCVQSRIWTASHNDKLIHFHLIHWHTDILSLALNCAHVSSCFQTKCKSEWIIIL